MQTFVTLTVQRTIKSKDKEDFKIKLDLLIKQLECLRFTVDVESEMAPLDRIEREGEWELEAKDGK